MARIVHETTPITLPLTVRDLDFDDLQDLAWSGSPEHLKAIAEALEAALAGEVAMLAIQLPNGNLVANGGVDFRKDPTKGEPWMLSVHEAWQSLGLGTLLIGALEDKIREQGRPIARIGVEHDNPRALALYRRLGYREVDTELDGWSIGGGRNYVTVCTMLEKEL